MRRTPREHTTHDGPFDFPGADALRDAGRVEGPRPETVDAARAALRAAMDAEAADAVHTGTAPAPEPAPAAARTSLRAALRGRRRRTLLTAAVAAVAASVILLRPGVGGTADGDGGTAPRAASGSAEELLHDLARVAADEPASGAPYWKNTVRAGAPADNDTFSTHTVYFDRQGRLTRVRNGKVERLPWPKRMAWYFGDGKPVTWAELDKLPTDPEQLAEMLGAGPGAELPDRQLGFSGVVRLLATSPADPELRSALYQVLPMIAEVRVIGPAQDHTGRKGTALEWNDGYNRARIIVDEEKAVVLEQESRAVSKYTRSCTERENKESCIARKPNELLHRAIYLKNEPAHKLP